MKMSRFTKRRLWSTGTKAAAGLGNEQKDALKDSYITRPTLPSPPASSAQLSLSHGLCVLRIIFLEI